MNENKNLEQIEIEELTNTWECVWREPGGETQYGWHGLPYICAAWLSMVSGNAVRHLLKAGLGKIIKTKLVAYGGTCRTILVDVEELDKVCRQYWDRTNAHEAATDRDSCHYCGMKATDIGFFGEPVCPECGG